MTTDNWDNYASTYLKATDVKNEDQDFIVTDVKDEKFNGKPVIRVELLSGTFKTSYDLRKEDVELLKAKGFTAPRMLLGKKIFFKIVQAKNPKTQLSAPSPRISRTD